MTIRAWATRQGIQRVYPRGRRDGRGRGDPRGNGRGNVATTAARLDSRSRLMPATLSSDRRPTGQASRMGHSVTSAHLARTTPSTPFGFLSHATTMGSGANPEDQRNLSRQFADAQQRTLPRYRQLRVFPVHHLPPPPRIHGPDLRKEIPLYLQPADLLVRPGRQGRVILGFLVLAVAEDAGGSFDERLLPSLNLAGVDFVPGGQLCHRLLPLDRLQSHLGLEDSDVLPSSLRHFPLLAHSNRCP